MLLHGVAVCWVWLLWNVLQALLDVYADVVAVFTVLQDMAALVLDVDSCCGI
jgi:hypothetical protein